MPAYYKDIIRQKDEYIGQQKEQLEKQNAAIEQQQEYIEGQRRQTAHYEKQLDEHWQTDGTENRAA